MPAIGESWWGEDCMNFNRHLIWYTSEPRVPVDRDQVDLHGEDNTRCARQVTIRYQGRSKRIALLSEPLHLPYVLEQVHGKCED